MTARDLTFMHTGLPSRPAFPIVSHVPNIPYSVGMHGTGFLVRRDRAVFLITAKHCLTGTGPGAVSAEDGAKNLLVPIPYGRARHDTPQRAEWMEFEAILSAKSLTEKDDYPGADGDLDIAVLPVKIRSRRAHSALLANAMKLPPTGDWVERTVDKVIDGGTLGDLPLQAYGFPLNGTGTTIDHDRMSIVTQGIKLVGRVTGKGPMPHVMTIEFPGAADSIDLNGMSGGPILLRLPSLQKRKSPDHFIAGMIFRGVYPTLHFVTIRWFIDAVNSWLQTKPTAQHMRLSR